jgi:hypothetical protein
MNAFLLTLALSVLSKAAPVIAAKLGPILRAQSIALWEAAYPLALNIVRNLASKPHADTSEGLAKHAAAVLQLKEQLQASEKAIAGGISSLDLGLIVQAAYTEVVKWTKS